MGVGIYLAFNPPLPDVRLGSDGKLLAKHLDMLDRLAQVAEVLPLDAFMDQREPTEEDFLLDEFMASWNEWFAPSEGRRTVKAILSVLQAPANPIRLRGDAVYLPRHLEMLLQCLRVAEARGAQFRIEVAM